MKINPLRKKYGAEKRWVNYRVEAKADGKPTKVPYSVTGRHASSTDPATWATLDEAMRVSKQVGIVFTPEKLLLGVDIDHCLVDGEISHEKEGEIREFVAAAETYVEVSPSGDGLHLYFTLTEPMELQANRHANFEAYTAGRYFTVTGRPYGEQKEVREIEELEAISLLSILGYPWGKENRSEELRASDVHRESGYDIEGDKISTEILNSGFKRDYAWTDLEMLNKMFTSKNGDAIKALYNGDLTAHAGDNSKADMALCAHLAFWTGRDAASMERMWLASPLGARGKTQDRRDYRDRTIAEAIRKCKNAYEDPRAKEDAMRVALAERPVDEEHPEIEFLYTMNAKKDIVVTLNTENIKRVLAQHPTFKGKLRYDEFKNIIEVRRKNGSWRMLEDNDDVVIQTRIQVLYPCFGKVGKEMTHDAIVAVAFENAIDSGADYVKGLVWDGVPRLDQWLKMTVHAPDDAYHRAVSANVIKGLVKRIMQPGCKFDHVLVLEGEQGLKKSTTASILGGEWYTETTMATDNKDFFMLLQGKAIIEFSEGETLSRTEVKRMKGIITTTVDRYRPSYGRNTMDFPRRCIFMMTTNQSEYLKDETGNRRWLPVKVEKMADTEWLAANREQLFAEAYRRVIVDGETVYEFPELETRMQQALRQVRDPNTDIVCDWYTKLNQTDRDAGITVHQAYRDAICGGFVSKILDRQMEGALTGIFKNILCLSNNRKRVDGAQVRRWFEKDGIEMPELELQPLTDLEKF